MNVRQKVTRKELQSTAGSGLWMAVNPLDSDLLIPVKRKIHMLVTQQIHLQIQVPETPAQAPEVTVQDSHRIAVCKMNEWKQSCTSVEEWLNCG